MACASADSALEKENLLQSAAPRLLHLLHPSLSPGSCPQTKSGTRNLSYVGFFFQVLTNLWNLCDIIYFPEASGSCLLYFQGS